MRDMHNFETQHQIFDEFIGGDQVRFTEKALGTYYDDHNGNTRLGYRGRFFDTWNNQRGDDPSIRNEVTQADVVSLTSLSINRHLGDIALTVQTQGAQISSMLAQIPVKPLYEVDKSVILPDSAAGSLWQTLYENGGSTRLAVAAYKLTARKRPDLLPVYDRVVERYIDAKGKDIWQCMWTYFHDDPARIMALRDVRSAAGISSDIPEIRCLDVALWMKATNSED